MLAVLVAVLAMAPVAAAEPVLEPMLGVDPDHGVAGTPVRVSGSCPRVDDPDGAFFPSQTLLTVEDVTTETVDLDDVGMFTRFPVDLPDDLAPGVVKFATGCDGEATFEVLPAPTLELAPDSAGPGADVVVTGTCPSGSTAPRLFLDGRFLGTVVLDQRTGEIGPTTVVVPDDTAPGDREVTTSCDGQATLTVPLVPSPTTTVPPAETLVTVPDLRGLTEVEVVDALAGQLVLANPTGAEGTVVDQDPPPGAQVRPGTPVQIELREAAAAEPAEAWSPVVLVGGVSALLVLLAAVMATRAALRRRRERRWLREHVAVAPAGAYLQLSDAPRGPVPGLEVDLEIRREPARWGAPEVVGGRR